MKNQTKLASLVFVVFALLLSGCGTAENGNENGQTNAEDGVLDIYTSIYPLEFFTREIGGEYVNAQSIMPAGTDAHTYEPTSKTIIDIAQADGFIYNNEELETYASKIKEAVKEENVKTLEASDGLALIEHTHEHGEEAAQTEETASEEHADHEEEAEDGHGHAHGELDPHLWLDPIAAIEMAEHVKEMLVELNPEASEDFETNFDNLKTELEALDAAYHEQLEASPKKEILVTHAAYGYWEKAYGIEQVAISGISTADEPSQKHIERIIESVKEHDIRYLLIEPNGSPKFVSVIQSETGLETDSIHNLETLTEENISNGEDYFSLMERNLDVLVKALGE